MNIPIEREMMQNPLFSMFVFLVMCFTSETVSAGGQQVPAAGPTLDNTLLFLTNAIANDGTCDMAGDDSVCAPSALDRMRGSMLTYTEGLIPAHGRPPKEVVELVLSKIVYTFDLKDLDPSRVNTKYPPASSAVQIEYQACVNMVSRNGGKIVTESNPNGFDPSPRGVTEVKVCFRKGETAERVAKAFQHAIELSGGRPSAF